MEYRQLGHSGLKISTLTLGTMMFGGPTDEATSARISDWLLRSHAQAFDAGEAPDPLAAIVKHVAIDNEGAAVEQAIDLAGNHGLARRNALERHHRNVLCSRIHVPTNSLIRGNAGRAALGA